MEKERPKFDLNNVPEGFRPYFEAKENGTLKEFYLKEFIHRRDDYSDELPDVDVRTLTKLDEKGHFTGDNYKCRGNYISALSLKLRTAVEDGIVTDPEVINKIEQFKGFGYVEGKRTTKEEIDFINQILADVIEHLEK
jgi:hypothetical protein